MSTQHQEDLDERARRYREGEQPAPPNGHREPSGKLSEQHRRELEKESGISPEVIAARGYETLDRRNDDQMRDRLRKLKMPTWSFRENWNFPGLLIPMFAPTGPRVSCQWKPANYVTHDGKKLRYASVKGQESRLDVHPFNVAKIVDAAEELWITEGVKKADALASRGVCVIALAGVWNWRNHLKTLGDWDDVLLKGRTITICYDADAREKPQVLNAMKRLRQWLIYKGAKKVWFLIVPSEANGKETKGVDDYLVAGGTLAELKTVRETKVPTAPDFADDTFSDAALAQTIADDVLGDQYIWVEGLNWLSWNSRQWAETSSAVNDFWELRNTYKFLIQKHLESCYAADPVSGVLEFVEQLVDARRLKVYSDLLVKANKAIESEMGQQIAPLPAVGAETESRRFAGADGRGGVDYAELVQRHAEWVAAEPERERKKAVREEWRWHEREERYRSVTDAERAREQVQREKDRESGMSPAEVREAVWQRRLDRDREKNYDNFEQFCAGEVASAFAECGSDGVTLDEIREGVEWSFPQSDEVRAEIAEWFAGPVCAALVEAAPN